MIDPLLNHKPELGSEVKILVAFGRFPGRINAHRFDPHLAQAVDHTGPQADLVHLHPIHTEAGTGILYQAADFHHVCLVAALDVEHLIALAHDNHRLIRAESGHIHPHHHLAIGPNTSQNGRLHCLQRDQLFVRRVREHAQNTAIKQGRIFAPLQPLLLHPAFRDQHIFQA